MGVATKIEWTDHTFNPWWGCQRVSPGCEHCYAETFAKRVGLNVWGPTSERRFFGEKHWAEPLKWDRTARETGTRRRVFCASMADVFEDRPELAEQRARLWATIVATPGLDWLLLTKRPENLSRMVPWGRENGSSAQVRPWPNVWLGTTVEDQRRADERIPELLKVPAVVRFLSMEPLLEWVDLTETEAFDEEGYESNGPAGWVTTREHGIDWVIVGGESGGGARPFNPSWAKSLVAQCRSARVPCFVKQLGANVLDFAGAIHDRKGGDWGEWPEELRIREWPDPTKVAGGRE